MAPESQPACPFHPPTPERAVEIDSVRELRRRSAAEDAVFWIDDNELAVFDPDEAQKVNALNFADLDLPDKLSDVVRGRSSEPFNWKTVRAAWFPQLRRLAEPPELARLTGRMTSLFDERLERPVDLLWESQVVTTRSLIPTVIDGLPPRDLARVERDQDYKLRRLVRTESEEGEESFWKEVRDAWVQMGGGSAVRRELRGRAKGKRPRRLDMADPIVDMLPDLGLDRAIDAVTTVLTAIAGPPGAAASCLLYELATRPDWAARMEEELGALPIEEIYAAPNRAAPVTHRFVKEVLRMWSPPVLMTRPVRNEIDTGRIQLAEGQRFLLSTYFIHHDERFWRDPDLFDPDRWLPDAPNGPATAGRFVPFGWSPKSCIGGALGLVQLTLLAHLFSTRYRIELDDPEAIRVVLAAVPLPIGFTGRIVRR